MGKVIFGCLQAQAEKLNNKELKDWKDQQNLTEQQWQRIKSHVMTVRQLRKINE